MSVTIPIVNTSGFITPSVPFPAKTLNAVCAGVNYVCYTEDDLYSALIPSHMGTNVNASDRIVDRGAVGISHHQIALPPTVRRGLTRNHDMEGCMWHNIEPSLGVYNWSSLDAWVANAFVTGATPIFVWIGSTTARSARPTEVGIYGLGTLAEPAVLQHAADFLVLVAQRYIARGTPIKHFEIGNEAKYTTLLSSYFSGTPAVLATVTRLCNQSLKAIDPTIQILSMSPTGCSPAWVLNDLTGTDYLHKMLSASDGAGGFGKNWVDILAYHAYVHDGFNTLSTIPQQATNMRSLLSVNSMNLAMPLWCTEVSAITPQYNTLSLGDRIAHLNRTLVLLFACGIKRVVWYSDGAGFGNFSAIPELTAAWNKIVALLEGATIGVVNYGKEIQVGGSDNNGKRYIPVYAVINGVRHVF